MRSDCSTPPPVRTCLGSIAVSAFMTCLAVFPAQAVAEMPQPPCRGDAPLPAFPTGTEVNVATWQSGKIEGGWVPRACTYWEDTRGDGHQTVVALTGRISLAAGQGSQELLSQMGAVSRRSELRYWSIEDRDWRPLVTSASALDSPEPRPSRADFSADELGNRRDHYYVQRNARSASNVVYRMRVREISADRLVVQTENVSRIRVNSLLNLQPGALQAAHYFQRLSPTSWGYYSLTRTTENGRIYSAESPASCVNRAVAFYRLLAGIPTDRDPPVVR